MCFLDITCNIEIYNIYTQKDEIKKDYPLSP